MKSNDKNQKRVFDFDAGMSPELKKAVYATEVYKRYAAERKRLSALAEKRVRSGGKLSDQEILEESAKLDKLTSQLMKTIKICARAAAKKSCANTCKATS